MSVDSVLDRLYRYCEAEDPEAALDLLLDVCDEALEADDYSFCDQLLLSADVWKLDVVVALGFLSATTRAKYCLQNRLGYIDRAWALLCVEVGVEEAEELLVPFR